MTRLDYYDILPKGMDAYLSHHGWHFSKSMCTWAVSNMRDRNWNKLALRTKEQVEQMLKSHGVDVKNNKGYDAVYVFHMVLADFYGSSIRDETNICKYVRDYLDDPDGYPEIAFSRFIADCNATDTPIDWEDMI